MPLMPLQPAPGQPYSPHPADSFVGDEPSGKPFKETPLRSALAAIPPGSIYCDFIRTICSDADGTSNGEGWAAVRQTGSRPAAADPRTRRITCLSTCAFASRLNFHLH